MENKTIISGVIIEKNHSLTLEEFCYATHTNKELVLQMIEYQLVSPEGLSPEEWRFDSVSLHRGRMASSFYRDLEVNIQGIALALDLIDKIEDLKHQLNILKKM